MFPCKVGMCVFHTGEGTIIIYYIRNLVNPFTPKILLVILLTLCHTTPMMFV